jgi:hypothetical protein
MTVVRTADEKVGQRIARKVIREMLGSPDHRDRIKEIAEGYVTNYNQGLYARKHVNIYCRQLVAALRKMP